MIDDTDTRDCALCGVYVHDEEQLGSTLKLPWLHRWCASDLAVEIVRALKKDLRAVVRGASA